MCVCVVHFLDLFFSIIKCCFRPQYYLILCCLVDVCVFLADILLLQQIYNTFRQSICSVHSPSIFSTKTWLISGYWFMLISLMFISIRQTPGLSTAVLLTWNWLASLLFLPITFCGEKISHSQNLLFERTSKWAIIYLYVMDFYFWNLLFSGFEPLSGHIFFSAC